MYDVKSKGRCDATQSKKLRVRADHLDMRLLTPEEITTFEREGWLLVKDFIPRGYIVALQAEIERVIDGQARKLFAEGKITDLHEDKDYLTRTAAIWDECPEIWSPVYSGNHAGKAMFELLSCDEMLDIMEQLVGPEIVAAGIYRLRPKLPDRPEGIVPWHQDAGYFGECADEHVGPAPPRGPGYVMTAWVPLMEATAETGPMQILPRAHQRGVLRHYGANVRAPGLTVHPDHIPDDTPRPVTVPCSVGDALLFGHMTPHRSEENNSGFIRWAADLRYTPPEAGDWGPGEGGFLARSAKGATAYSDANAHAVRNGDEFVQMRKNHKASPRAPPSGRTWLSAADEHFATTLRRPLERIEEYEGRMSLLREKETSKAKL